MRKMLLTIVAIGSLTLTGIGFAQHSHEHNANATDNRILVKFPDALKQHTLTNMRAHLLALANIQEAIGKADYDKAAKIAEQQLGMTSLKQHGASENAKYMPQAMQDIGTTMHRSASQFAIEIQNSSATGDIKPAMLSLSKTTQACVACHAGFRLQ
jgi:hypothetical protein